MLRLSLLLLSLPIFEAYFHADVSCRRSASVAFRKRLYVATASGSIDDEELGLSASRWVLPSVNTYQKKVLLFAQFSHPADHRQLQLYIIRRYARCKNVTFNNWYCFLVSFRQEIFFRKVTESFEAELAKNSVEASCSVQKSAETRDFILWRRIDQNDGWEQFCVCHVIANM